MVTSTNTIATSAERHIASTSAALGAVLWLAAPSIPAGARPAFGSIEHVFLFVPLVATPLAMQLVASLHGRATRAHRAAVAIQPIAAAMVLASFFLERGAAAGALAAGWPLTALACAAGNVRPALRAPSTHLSRVSSIAALAFFVIGAVWLVLSRLGVRPFDYAHLTVFLAALHFQVGGFVLQLLVAATARALPVSTKGIGALHRSVAIATIAGIVLIAAGNAARSPDVKIAGVAAMVLGTLGLAVTSTAVAVRQHALWTRTLLLASAGSIVVGMLAAAVYGASELTGRSWITLASMVPLHGAVNVLGFALSGLLGQLALRAKPS